MWEHSTGVRAVSPHLAPLAAYGTAGSAACCIGQGRKHALQHVGRQGGPWRQRRPRGLGHQTRARGALGEDGTERRQWCGRAEALGGGPLS